MDESGAAESNVVSLRGAALPAPGEPVQRILDMIEGIRSDALAGRVRSFCAAWIVVTDADFVSEETAFSVEAGQQAAVYMAIARLKRRFEARLDD